jgi:hypothetical protein
VAGLVVFLIAARGLGEDVRTQRTLVLSTLVLLGLSSLARVAGEDGPAGGGGLLLLLACAGVPAYATAMYWPPATDFFQLTPLTGAQWGLVLAAVVPAFFLCKLADWLEFRKYGASSGKS